MRGYHHDNAFETQPRTPRRFAQVSVGTALPPLVQGPITRTQFVKYAGASGDFHPIHHDEEYAKQTPAGGLIANGVMIMGFLGKCATAWLGTPHFSRLRARNLAMVRPGDTLLIEGQVVEVVPGSGAGGTVRLAMKTSVQATGVVVCAGEIDCALE